MIGNKFLETVHLRIQNFQLDNNSQVACKFPVFATAKTPLEMVKQGRPILSLVVERAHKVRFVNYFKNFQFSIQPLAVKVTEGTLEDLYQF